MDKVIKELNEMCNFSKDTMMYELKALVWRVGEIETLIASEKDFVPYYQLKLDLKNTAENICRHYENIVQIDSIKRRLRLYKTKESKAAK